MTWLLRLVERKPEAEASGRTLYNQNCATCHREDLAGTPPEFPNLVGITGRRTEAQIRDVTLKGAGRMPGFKHLQPPVFEAILTYVMKGEDLEIVDAPAAPSPTDLKYRLDGYVRFTDPDGYPAIAPPWGTLNALDLNTGKYVWQVPLGEHPGTRREGDKEYGERELRGLGSHGRRATLHRRHHQRSENARLRQAHGEAALGVHDGRGR